MNPPFPGKLEYSSALMTLCKYYRVDTPGGIRFIDAEDWLLNMAEAEVDEWIEDCQNARERTGYINLRAAIKLTPRHMK